MDKVWIVFAFDDYYPEGGPEDVIGVFSSKELADDFVRNSPEALLWDNILTSSFTVDSK